MKPSMLLIMLMATVALAQADTTNGRTRTARSITAISRRRRVPGKSSANNSETSLRMSRCRTSSSRP
jgi:hypothetical protein